MKLNIFKMYDNDNYPELYNRYEDSYNEIKQDENKILLDNTTIDDLDESNKEINVYNNNNSA